MSYLMFVSLSFCSPINLSVCPIVKPFLHLSSVFSSGHLPICLYIVHLFVNLSVHLSVNPIYITFSMLTFQSVSQFV
jgi:hypothetical protein